MASTMRSAQEQLQAPPAQRVWWVAAVALALCSALLTLAGLLPAGQLPAGQPLAGQLQGGPAALAEPADGSAAGPARDAALRFEPDVVADIAAYRSPRRIATLVSRSLAVVVPLLVAATLAAGRGERLLRKLRRLPGVAGPVGAAVGVTVVVTAVVRLPLTAWAGLVHDGAWGFRTRSVPGWLLDLGLVVAGRAALIAVLAAGVVALVRRHPRTWPARLTVLVAVVGPLALLLHPLVVHPLLLPTTQLPDGPHRDAVAVVVARSGADVPVLLGEASLRTTRRNAVATGLGPTRRIVLHDTLLELSPRAVAAITAHELVHVQRRDPLRGVLAPVPAVLLASLATRRRLVRLPAARPAQIRTLATAAVLVLALEAAATPLTAAVSRTVELRTDVDAVFLSGDVDAYVTVLRSFVVDGLADPDPPRWSVLLWATHPTPSTRITAVLDVEALLSVPVDLATR